MREYSLQNPEYRKTVDLRDYKTMIEDAIHSISPTTEVVVHKDCYTISPDLSKGELIKIGRILAQSERMGEYCMVRSILFKGEKIDEVTPDDKTKNEQKIIKKPKKGGHL